jgi:hypothetical protein
VHRCGQNQDDLKDQVPAFWLATQCGSPHSDGCYLKQSHRFNSRFDNSTF